MATRCKTVEYVFPTDQSTLLADTPRELTPVNVHLPESGLVFRSVTLEIGCTDQQSTTGGSSATEFAMSFAFLRTIPEGSTVADTVTNSGQSSVYHISLDLTDYFNLHWIGPFETSGMTVSVGGNATNNHWAKLKITYDYDEESAKQIKTIWYPIESTQDLLTTTYQTVGGVAAIPAIKAGASILPEHNVAVRQVWVELVGNQGTADTTDFSLDVKLAGDGTEQTTLYRVEAASATPGSLHAIWDVTLSELDNDQAFEAKVTGITDRVAQLCGWVGITYEFEPVGTTLVWNSLILPAFDNEDQHGSSTSTRKTLHVKQLWIEEPTTITAQASQVFAFYSDNGAGSSISLWVNEQSPRSFTTLATGAPMVVAQRMDGGGTSGQGITLARGRNQIKVNQFADNSQAGAFSAVNGFMIVNYTSGVSSAGVGAHNQTRHFALGWYQGDATALEYSPDTVASRTPAIPEERYFLNAVGMQAAWMSTAASHQGFRVQAQRTDNEGQTGDGAGWANVYHGAVASSSSNWLRWTTADCTQLFRRWTSEPELARMDLEASRRWMVLDAASVWVGIVGLLVTYHSITKTARGTVSGSAVDGSGLLVSLSRDLTGEKVLEAVTTEGGHYQAAWYDDTEQLVADVFEDDAHVGRSAPFYAGGLYEPPPPPDPDPILHRQSHELGGDDALDVTGLAGVLANNQPAIPAAGLDTSAIHVDGVGEIAGLTLLSSPSVSDHLLIETASSAIKRRISIGSLPPSKSPMVFAPHLASLPTTGWSPPILGQTTYALPYLQFHPSETQAAFWITQMPPDYKGGTVEIKFTWTGTTTSTGDVRVWLYVEKFTDGENTTSHHHTVTDARNYGYSGVQHVKQTETIYVTNSEVDGVAAGDLMSVRFLRLGTSSADDYTGYLRLLGMRWAYDV